MSETQDLEVHLATCSDCAGELAQYRGLLGAMGSLRYKLEDTPPGFAAGILALVAATEQGLAERVVRVAHDPRVQVAAASVGGLLLGAAAIGVIWWRAAKRSLAGAD
ncbi:MAG: hypothetical protein ACRDH9_11565 [Actinomycetota bacterium]